MNSISVIMPTFNRANLIGRALESVIGQTYPHIEIVVVDDGSTDTTRNVVIELERGRSRVIVYRWQENAGCAAARNTGLDLATGEFIAFLDSDDVWLPAAAESLRSCLVETRADFVYSPAVEIYPDGTERLNYPVAAERPDIFAVEHFMDTNLRNGAFMFRSDVLSSVQGLDESLLHNEDSDFIQRMAVRHTATYCRSPTVRVYHHEGNKSLNRPAVYRALIASAAKVLAENPTFAAALGESAEQRLRKLETRYVESLILAGEYEEARNRIVPAKESLILRFALKTRSALTLKLRNRLKRWKDRAMRKSRRMFRVHLRRGRQGSNL